MKKIFVLILAVLYANIAGAQNVKSGDDVIIGAPVNEDLYIAAGTVTINAPVRGDLVIGGGTVIINDTAIGDVMVCGGNVKVNGFIGDDLRGVGGDIYINGVISGDLAMSGGTISIMPKAIIGGNMLLGGGTLNIGGTIKGSLRSAGGNIKFNGVINQNADCRADQLMINGIVKGKSTLSAHNLTIGNSASFYNDVQYWSNAQGVDFKQSIKRGDALYEPSLEMESDKWQYLGFATFLGVLWYLTAAFIFIVTIQYLFGNSMKKVAVDISTRPLRSIGYGLVFFVTIPLAIIILIITIIGIPIGILILISYIVLALLATVISSVVIANWFNDRQAKRWGNRAMSFAALGIFILLKLISLIPVLGWLAVALVILLIFGSILQNLNWKRRKSRNNSLPVTQ